MNNVYPNRDVLFEEINREAEEYPNRRTDIQSLERWLQNGNFEMARHAAEEIIKRQRQLRTARSAGLPVDLQNLLRRVESEVEEYPKRQSDLEALSRWLQNGNFDMARYTAEEILKRQQQLRLVRSSGLPVDLQNLLQQIELEVEDYPKRQSDLRSLRGWLENGNLEMAYHNAGDILHRQRQLRSAREVGLPADLQ